MLKFFKAGLIFYLSLLGFLFSSPASLFGQCSFTNLNSPYCIDQPAFTLTGGTNYFGPGVTGTSFDPGVAGIGTHQLVTTNGLATSYTVVTSGSFNPELPVLPIAIPLNDNDEQLVNIGFTFNFFGINYTQLRIGSNGLLGMGGAGPALTSVNDNQSLGDATNPNNIIAVAWDNLTPNVSGTIRYFVVGAAPFRKFVVEYLSVDRTSTFDVTVQAQLHETTNIIELHTTDALFLTNAESATQGIESHDLGLGVTTSYVVPGRNNAQWDASGDFVSFVPTCLDIQAVTVVDQTPTASLAGGDQNFCGTTVTLGANAPAVGTGAWSFVVNPDALPLTAFSNTALPTSTFTGTAGQTYVLRWTISNGVCTPSTDEVQVRLDQAPTTSVSGGNQTICGTSTNLNGTLPVIGTGQWSFTSNPDGLGVISDINSRTSLFTGTPGQSYILTWTITSGTCAASSSNVTITFNQTPTASLAGGDQNFCGTTVTLGANAPAVGTGAWSFVVNPDGLPLTAFSNTALPTSTFTGTAGQTYVLRWTISNGVCTPSTDEVQVRLDQAPTTSVSGGNQTICGTSTNLNGTLPVIGTGQWSFTSNPDGLGVISDINSRTSLFTGTPGQSYILTWTITSGTCAASSSNVTITFNQTPTPSLAGGDQNFCGTTVTLGANAPAVGTGAWSFVVNPDGLPLTAFSNTALPTSTFTGTAGQTYVLRWTISNGVCTPSTDDVQVRLDQAPTTSVSGGNQTICGTSTNLNGTLPVIGTGQWSFTSNPDGLGAISDINSRTSLFTGTPGQSYILTWTITSGTCAPSSSNVTITFNQTPTASLAGGDQNFCGTTVTLGANAPAVGTGAWSFVVNPDALPLTAFSNTALPTSTFTGTAGQTYVLRWTISNGVCTPSTDEVQVRLDQAPTTSVSGGNQTICGTSTNLNGTLPVIGTGQWSFTSNPDGLGVISDINSRTSLFTGTPGQSYILTWTITSGTCAASSSNVTITFNQTPTASLAGADQNFCGTTVTLGANAPAVGTGAWSFVVNPDGLPLTAFSNTALPTSTFTGTAGQTYVLRWTISNGVCTPSTDDVQVRLDQAPTTSVSGGNQTICGTSTNLNGTLPVIGTGQWSFTSNPDGLGAISDINSRTSLFTGTPGQSYILTWTITSGTCASSSSNVTITFNQTPTASLAGADQNFCGTTVTLGANAPAVGTGAWSFVVNPDGLPLTAFSNTALPTSTFTGTAGQTYVLRWTISNGVCSPSTDDVQVRLDQAPTTSVSGGNQTICGTSTNLNGTLPVIGTGQWSFTSNPDGLGAISDINSRTSLFTGTPGQSYILTWTITSGTCASSSSNVTITFNQTPTASLAGADQNFCGTTVTLGANAPAVGTGAWSFVVNPDGLPLTAFSNTALPTSTFTGTAGQTYVLRWTISNGVCTPSTDDVQVRLDQAPTTSVSGGNQTICGTSTNLNGTLPVIGTGQWSFTSNPDGLGVISDINSRTSLFTGTPGQSYILTWTITSGTCAASSSNVTITFNQTPTASLAGGDQNFCGTTVTLGANAPAVGTGAWSFVVNPDGLPLTAFSNTALPTSTFTGTAGQTYVLRWTISNGVCTPSTDDVQVRLDQAPTTSVSGGNQTICGTSTNLNGTLPVIGTGQWSFTSNPDGLGVISDINSRTSLFTGTPGQSYILTWTITSGTCASSSSNVTITFNQTPTASLAGGDQNFCGTTVTLGANAPAVGTGAWSFVVNPDALPLTAFSNTALPTSTFTGTAGQTYVLRWTISNGVCTPSTDDVQVRLYQAPTTSVSGGNQTICGTSTNLNGTLPVIGTGQWSFTSNPDGLGVISDINSRTSLFTGTPGQSYILTWTITSGTCAASSSNVTITFNQTPTASLAGGDQNFCGTTVTLGANAPAVGTGAWSFVVNPDGLPLTAFSNTALPTSTFTGTAGQTYVLRWTISNGVCTPSTDEVQVRLDQAPTTSVSGGNQTICGTSTNLNGTLPVIGTGQWSFTSNPDGLGVISDINSRTSLFTGTPGQSYILTWTITSGTCAASSSNVTITFNQTPTASLAGGDQNFCGTTVTLGANAPAVGTGAWSFVVNPDGLPLTAFSNTALPTSTFTGTAGQTYVLRWTISNGVCTPSTDDVQVRLDQAPTTSVSGGNQTICGTSTNLNGTLPVIGTGQWSFTSNPDGLGVISDINSRTSLFTGTPGQSYILTWTITSGTCASSSSNVTITFNQTPTASLAGADQNFCGTTVTLGANAPAVGTGAWSFVVNPDGLPLTAFSNTALPTSTFTGTAGQTYVLRWTISNGVCTPSTDDVQVRLDQAPTTSVSGGNQTICGTSTNLNGTLPVIGTGQWSFTSNPDGLGAISDINSRTSLFTGTPGQSYILTWTITSGTCAASSSNVTITFNQTPTASLAGGDQNFCGTTVTLGANAPAVGTGAWSFVVNPDALPLTAFSNTALPTSTFTGTAGQTYVLRWTISNGVCTPSTDDVQVRLDQAPTTSVSGGNQTICGTSTNLNGTLPVIGTGQWSFTSNPDGLGVISDINSRTSLFTGTPGQSYILTWTITSGTCATSSSNVTITFNQTPTASLAGGDQNFCGTTVTLGANAPAVGTGAWSFVVNPDGLPLTAFSNTALPTSTFTGTAGQTYVLRWTISNGVCTPSTDEVQVRLDQAPTTSVSGGNQTICGTSTNLNGTLPVIGTGQWSFTSNPDGLGVISDINSRTSLFTGTPGQSYILTWTITSGTCATSSSNVTITFNQTPTASLAGGDQNFCGTTVTLGANAPAVGTGAWSFVVNPDGLPLTAFSNTALPTSTFTGTAGQTYVLRWTISNGVCTPSTDDVQVRLDQAPTTSVSGGNQTICGTSTNLNGTLPVIGTGQWSFTSNPDGLGVISDINSRTSLFTGTPGQSYILTWTISNGTCAASSSNVTITFNQTPTASLAGGDQNFCGTTVTLGANAPAVGTGAWSFVVNPDGLPLTAFSNTALPTSTFTGTAGQTYVLRWTISNGVCTPSTDDVQIHFDANPLPVANAGANQTVCTTTAILAANAPTTGIGTWTIVSGAAGSFVDANNPTTIFYGVSGQIYNLQWTISNGVCPSTSDNVLIQFDTPPTAAAAGPDQAVCSTSIILAGNAPTTGTGQWTIVSGLGGTILSNTNPTTTFSGAMGTTYVLAWTITNGVCAASSDQVTVRLDSNPVVTLPADYTVCQPASITLNGSLSGSATSGIWSIISGSGSLSASSLTGTTVSASYTPSIVDVTTTVTLRLTSNTSGTCAAAFDDINILINRAATVYAGPDDEVCENETINLNGTIGGATGTVTWSGGAGGTFSNINSPITTYTLTPSDIAAGGILFTLTSNDPDGAAPCNPATDQVYVRIHKLPEVFIFGLAPTYAENNPVAYLDGIPAGGTFTGSGINAGTNEFDPGNASLGPVDIYYTYTNPITGCTNSTFRSTIVNPVTSVDFDIQNQTTDAGGNPQICANSGFLQLIGFPATSTGSTPTLFRSPDAPSRIVSAPPNFYIATDGLAPGTYQVQYIYTNSLLATDTLTKVVTVFAAPKAMIDFDRICVADSLTYTDTSYIPLNPSAATIVAYDWSYGEFGNGNDGVMRNPRYKYTDHGSKTVGLTVTTSQGCSHDTTKLIRVGPLPNVDFTWSKVCSGLEVTEFKDISTTPLGYSQLSQYQWSFGDGDILAFGPKDQNVPPGTHSGRTTGTYTNPNHDYSLFTTFNVQLTVTTEDGCTGTKANDVIILDYVTPTASGGYSTDFEIGSNPWVVSTTSSNSSWLYGPPTGNVIQPSAPANSAWWTGSNADPALSFSTFNNDETSEVLSPCLNLTDLKRPMISLDYWSDMRGAFDGAVVQFSTDDGNTWQTIGNADGYGINWYDTQNITSNVGGQDNFAWSGADPTKGWRNARFNLDQIPVAERDLVRFRVAFASNGDNPNGDILNGFAFDNIYIGEKNRNVLVEHFTNDNSGASNNSDQFIEDMYDDQIDLKDSSDFIAVQYHMAGDAINLENTGDPSARQTLYGVSQAPTTVMDGIQGQYFNTNFDGLLAKITPAEIDRRALEDPSFSIDIDTVSTGDNTTLGLNIRYTYIDSLNSLDIPVTFHAALIERGINGNGNVIRKLLLGSDGHTVAGPWDASIPTVHNETFDYTIDIPVVNPDNLYIVAFVQDNSENTLTSRRILQSAIIKGPRKIGPLITGVEDSPTMAELKGLIVYPNPASNVVNLHSDVNLRHNYTWKLIDQRGVPVLTGKLQKDFSYGDQEIEVRNLPNGMYIMAIQVNEKSVVHKKVAVMNKN